MMTEKRYYYGNGGDTEVFDRKEPMGHPCGIEFVDRLNEQHNEIMDLRFENTSMKLILLDIIEDLEKQAESKEPIIISMKYVEWIKENVNIDSNEFGKKDGSEKGVDVNANV